MKKYKTGYTQGVYDMFHVGHLNLLRRAKEQCEYLIVGVNSDRLVQEYKHHSTVIAEEDRKYIIENIKAVDECFIADTLDKTEIIQEHPFDVIFIGDDWKGNARWKKTEEELKPFGATVVYLPHTPGVSSTELREEKEERVHE